MLRRHLPTARMQTVGDARRGTAGKLDPDIVRDLFLAPPPADADAGEGCGDRTSACDLGCYLGLILEARVAGAN